MRMQARTLAMPLRQETAMTAEIQKQSPPELVQQNLAKMCQELTPKNPHS